MWSVRAPHRGGPPACLEGTNSSPGGWRWKCPLLMNSSTAWSPPGWCISNRDPPGDPWCRTMNFPHQRGLHQLRELLFTIAAWRLPSLQLLFTFLSFVFSIRISFIHFPFLAYCLSFQARHTFYRLWIIPKLGHFDSDKKIMNRESTKKKKKSSSVCII